MARSEALEILFDINTSTVIDSNWYDYIKDSKVLEALLAITELSSYKEILEYYEGWYVQEIIEER